MWPEVEVPLSADSSTGSGAGSSAGSDSDTGTDNGAGCGSGSETADCGSGSGAADYESSPVRITQMGCPMHLSACPPRYDHAGYPEGYHTEEILTGLGYTAQEIEEMI